MNRTNLGARIGGDGGGIEGRVLDVVTHRHDVLLPHRFNVDERPAMVQPELSGVLRVELVAEVHELRRRSDVELHPFENALDGVALETQESLHPLGVDRAGTHPLVDRHGPHDLSAERTDGMGHAGAIDELTAE